MLVIKIELWPYGDETKAKELARMDLWNDGTLLGELGNYEASSVIHESPWGEMQRRGGKVLKHNRHHYVWSLVAKMLKAMGYGV
jgi:hypothetical protein